MTRPRQPPFARRVRCAAAAAGVALALATACSENGAVPASVPGREGRFGSLRDLVLFDRPGMSAAHALFVDRFEVTRADWAAFAATPEGRAAAADEVPTIGEPTLPVASVDLRQARAFARWRFLRLPRSDEWWLVAVGDGNSLFPWGNREDATRANTGELGLGQPTPVGTFESGRRAAEQPYDLVGNVSEWTETVSSRWWDGDTAVRGAAAADAVAGMPRCRRAVLANPMLALWQGPGGTVPLGWLAIAGGGLVPRDVVGSDFQSPMSDATLVEPVLAGDRRARTGLRLYATAAELLLALTHDAAAPAPNDAVQLRRFVQRRDHRAVLAQAWAELVLEKTRPLGAGPLAAILRGELGYGDGDGDAPR